MSIPEYRYYVDQHVAAQWADDTYRQYCRFNWLVDSWVIQQIREKTSDNGTKEYEYYVHYIDCTVFLIVWHIDDKRMEGWVPASRIAPLNKKSLKRLRDVDCSYADKVSLPGLYKK